MRQFYGDKDGCTYINYDHVKKESDKAKLYIIHDVEIWLPKSQIIDDNGEIVVIPAWLAEKNGLESDW